MIVHQQAIKMAKNRVLEIAHAVVLAAALAVALAAAQYPKRLTVMNHHPWGNGIQTEGLVGRQVKTETAPYVETRAIGRSQALWLTVALRIWESIPKRVRAKQTRTSRLVVAVRVRESVPKRARTEQTRTQENDHAQESD